MNDMSKNGFTVITGITALPFFKVNVKQSVFNLLIIRHINLEERK